MITAIIFRAGVFRKSWRFRFVGANGEKLGHDYNDPDSARETLKKIIDPRVPVRLRVENEDGTVTDHGPIR
jgi:hypothetical protein